MRKSSFFLAQDHLIYITETDEQNDEVSCVNNNAAIKGVYANSIAFLANGTLEFFSGDSHSIVPDTHFESISAPALMTYRSGDSSLGIGASSNTSLFIGIIPRDDKTVGLWAGQLDGLDEMGEDGVSSFNRDNVFCFGSNSINRKRNLETFELTSVPDDVNITGIVYD